MKKKIAVLLVLALSCLLFLSGCGSGTFDIKVKNGKAVITAEKAAKESSVLSPGIFTVEKGQKIKIESAMQKGKVMIRLYKGNVGSDGTSAKPEYEKKFKDFKEDTVKLEPGEYTLSAVVVKKATGKITLKLK